MTIDCAVRRRKRLRSGGPAGAAPSRSRVHRPRHARAIGRRNRRGARRARRVAARRPRRVTSCRSSCTCLAEDFADILAILADIARTPDFPGRRRSSSRGPRWSRRMRQDEDNPAVRAVEALLALLYGADHPYGRRTAKGTIASRRADPPRRSRWRFTRARFASVGLTLVDRRRRRPPRRVDASPRGVRRTGRAPPAEHAPVARRRRRVAPAQRVVIADARTSRSPTSPTASPPSAALDPALLRATG